MKNVNDARAANGFRMNHEEKVSGLFKEIIWLSNVGHSIIAPDIFLYTPREI